MFIQVKLNKKQINNLTVSCMQIKVAIIMKTHKLYMCIHTIEMMFY